MPTIATKGFLANGELAKTFLELPHQAIRGHLHGD